MHFMASPATFLTAAYERILFTNHSSGSAFVHCAEPQSTWVSHKHCCVGRRASIRLTARARGEVQCNKSVFPLNSGHSGTAAIFCVCTAAYLSQRAARSIGARIVACYIQCGAGKDCSGRRTMDLFVVGIIVAMLFTVATVFLGVCTMSVGGSTDTTLSTPLMWARVGFRALTL